MANVISVKEAAMRWELAERTVRGLCIGGKIHGAIKSGRSWLIPAGAEKPVDNRIKTGAYVRAKSRPKHLPLPVGVSDYRLASTEYYYIDKTMMLKDFIDERPMVTLFTRPRRFGKTLNMDMLRTFFEKTNEDTSKYFKDKKIWEQGEYYRSFQGKYPVIFITLKDVKHNSWDNTFANIGSIISSEYCRHSDLSKSPKLDKKQKDFYDKMVSEKFSAVDLERSLLYLSEMLKKHYGEGAVIIIDEYDTPIQSGHTNGFYDDVIAFMRNLLSGAFKDNSNLSYGFLTGILRVAKESIFSGLNNLKVNSILEDRYSEYFGFTKDEIRGIMEYYGRTDKYEEICKWYDGYRFGDTDIFNPWSVLNYMDENCSAKAYWQSTGDNSIIRQIVAEADDETADNLRKLMQGQMVSSYVDTSVIYPEIRNNPTTIYSFLLSAGYLKVVKKDELHDGNAICDIAIPNKEIFYVYEKEILSALTNVISQSTAIAIQQAIIRQDVPKLQDNLQKLLLNSISSFDYAHENFYHGLILGICAIMNNLYRVDSNRESGHGRYDIQLRPYDKKMPGIIIELKVLKDGIAEACIDTELEASAKEALAQIERRQYVTAMKQEGITHFFKIGVSFYKKRVKLLSDTE